MFRCRRLRCLGNRFEMTRNYDALAGHQRRAFRAPVHLGDRPQRHVVSGRDRLQAVAWAGKHRRSAVPEIDGGLVWNDIAKRDRVAVTPCCRELQDLGHELLLERVHLLNIDIRNITVLGKVEARKVPSKSRLRLDVTAAEDVLRQKDVDEAIDVQRHFGRHMGWIDGDHQVRTYALGFQDLGELYRAETAHRMADQDDRLRVFAIFTYRLRRNQATNGEFVDIGCNARFFEPLAEAINTE